MSHLHLHAVQVLRDLPSRSWQSQLSIKQSVESKQEIASLGLDMTEEHRRTRPSLAMTFRWADMEMLFVLEEEAGKHARRSMLWRGT